MPDSSHLHTNRLIDATSPYLLQHAHNPVDWHPWGAEALQRARRENKPIFLSIGYSACHWCHVMEREVFENEEIAALMNAQFINIKVDREERPDLDDLYMLATQLMSGSGGWPMSVWLTPDLRPFYAGTYFPPVDGYGRPGFPRLITALADSWKNRRAQLEEQAEKVVEAIRMHADETGKGAGGTGDLELPLSNWISLAVEQMADRFDQVHGGLGGAPKFPPHQALLLWLGLLSGGHRLSSADQGALRDMVTRTLDGMMNGGIYDHVGGAFARYSTDEKWLVPHFEKMLYDSAQLAPVYAAAGVLLDREDYRRVARETLGFFLREMKSTEDGFFSALDADSEGHEGLYYVWTLADVHAALPDPADAELVIAHYGITNKGNWHESPVEGGSVLATAGETADRRKLDACHLKMREFRAKRTRPFLDDKILTAWNGLMISALAVCGRLLKEPVYVDGASRAMEFLSSRHMREGRLLRVSRDGKAHTDGFLDDHAFVLNGVMDLVDAVPEKSAALTAHATELAGALIRDFEDLAQGGFFYTAAHHEKLFVRMKNAADNATPSANGVAIRALLRLARRTGAAAYRETALRAAGSFAANIDRRPEWFPTILLGLLEDADPERAVESPTAAASEADANDTLQLAVEDPLPQRPGDSFDVRARLFIADGYHIQPHGTSEKGLSPTVARIRGDAALAAQEWRFPPAALVSGTDVTGHTGTLLIATRCTLPADAKPGKHAMRLTVLAQPCSSSACLAPLQVTATFTLTIVSS